ncbi:hypothetical protein DSO57_1034492 [Entomophthora muscae]|uniref:Uncharacterized protein n=1 Tax=Entomophthora muscae TaxID=34485 RepID=A0ACC2TYH0_9FUNG|nr:hypothetical protein DSO57_1034492 [Entomophthora muscae]
MSSIKSLKSILEREGEAQNASTMKALILKKIKTAEADMDSIRNEIGMELILQLTPREHSGQHMGFVRKVLPLKIPLAGKATDNMVTVVDATLKELLGDDSASHNVDMSAIIDLDDLEDKISPVVRDYLNCKSSIEGVNFIVAHPELI